MNVGLEALKDRDFNGAWGKYRGLCFEVLIT